MSEKTAKLRDTAGAGVPALDVDAILDFHRDPAGWIGFVRKPDPPKLDKRGKSQTFENLFSIRADDLRKMLPAFAEWLTQDSYYTINSYYRPAPYANPATGLPDVWRKEKYLSKLTACYADIDCGRPDEKMPGAELEWWQAVAEAGILADRGMIPPASVVARSGRGAYLFWLLRDEKDPDKPPHAWPEKVQLYKLINRALVSRLQTHALPADSKAIDAARVLRVPGSIHRKTGRRVEYIVQLDAAGRGFVYTLPELATFLELSAPTSDPPEEIRALAKPAQYRRVKNPGSAPLRSLGKKALNALRVEDLLAIEQWRGGFKRRGEKYPDGSTSPGRRFVLAMYAGFLRGAGAGSDQAAAALSAMAKNMRPPYPSDPPAEDPPVEAILQAEYSGKVRRWGNAKLCALLGITDEAARDLELQTIRPPAVALEADRARPTAAERRAARLEFARQYLEKHRHTTARGLANAYHHAAFVGANRQTANEDLNALGYVMNRSAGGRPRKALKVAK